MKGGEENVTDNPYKRQVGGTISFSGAHQFQLRPKIHPLVGQHPNQGLLGAQPLHTEAFIG